MKLLDNRLKIYDDDINIIGFNNEMKAMYCDFYYEKTSDNVLVVAATLYEANQLYQYISNYRDDVLLFPTDDLFFDDAVAISPELKIKRVETLIQIINNKRNIVVTNLAGYSKTLPSKEIFKNNILSLKCNSSLPIDELIDRLYKMGYKRETLVTKTGEFAVRGFVIDVFSIYSDNPIRIEFFGDEIDSIRFFDINDQKSIDKTQSTIVYPITDSLLSTNTNKTTTILDFMSADVTVFDDYNRIINKNENKIYDINNIKNNKIINFSNFDDKLQYVEQTQNFKIVDINDNFENIESTNITLNKYINSGYTVVVALSNKNKIIKFSETLENKDVVITNENQIFPNKINVINKRIIDSFLIDDIVFISEQKIFNSNIKKRDYRSKFRYGTKLKDLSKLNAGDFVVHTTHGIGIYLGLTTLTKNNLKKDYLQIEYKGGDKLYIPVEKIELISKYSAADGVAPKINKLGGTEWKKTTLKVRKNIENIARDLLKLYALRENIKGFSFDKDSRDQIDFEKSFEHEETADQLKVVEEIKRDMESSHPMDRLLCGDVGYGKTEVAFRVMFKAILSGKQVAMLCPTTILSNQHYQNALNRFKDFPVNIALLNRFVSAKKASEIKDKLKNGKIDIVFGTHRILSDDITFKDLGLLIIDEEQRFGVKHKEKIKQIKENIDVLTLSATPIPRTLQMAMSGVKSLSLIETPPTDRYPVQTYVLSENDNIIKQAIYNELSRDGQAFILYNNIEKMEEKLIYIKNLVPEANVVIAHGKMNKIELEDIMLDFTNKKYNVLLCTTIIETGIDIPNVNTLIVMDADRFGLSQLYQLRGRVGRSNKIAYCYLFYKSGKVLTDIAEKRLKVIKDFTELGSGFSIAMRDLSIRGAGSILGSEQAGFVDAVGIEMFLKLLEEEIKKLKGEKIDELEETNSPLVEVSTNIDDNYVSSEELKIYIHQRINEIDNIDKLNEVKFELSDRFGKLSENIIVYMYEELFEQIAKKLGIKDIRQTKNFIEILLPNSIVDEVNIDILFIEVTKLSKLFRFKTIGKRIAIILDTIKLDRHFIYYLIDLMNLIENIKKQK